MQQELWPFIESAFGWFGPTESRSWLIYDGRSTCSGLVATGAGAGFVGVLLPLFFDMLIPSTFLNIHPELATGLLLSTSAGQGNWAMVSIVMASPREEHRDGEMFHEHDLEA